MGKLTDKQIIKYLKAPYSCPYCKSPHIEGQDRDFEDKHAYNRILCNECGKAWQDEYTLTGIVEED